MAELLLALDRASVRSYDGDGRLHIKLAHISKANVCPYKGSEIPNSEKLGLEPNKIYYLLRDPKELEKAAPTSNNIQLLIKHDPVSVADPKKDLTVGSTGTDAQWNPPYLDNSLVVWDKEAIEGIESDEQKELSAGYFYVADMTPGEYEGVKYDGVMRNIRFNHVALVVEGRAGSDVAVGDSMENLTMTINRKQLLSRTAAMAKGAIAVCLQPRLAQDAKLDLNNVLSGVTPKNWGASKVKIVSYLKGLPVKNFKDQPAMDAAITDVVKLLDSLDGEQLQESPDITGAKPGETNDANPDANLEGELDTGGTAVGKDSPKEAILAMLKGKVPDEDLAKIAALLDGAAGQDDADGDDDVEAFLAKLMSKMKPAAGAGEVEDEAGLPGTSDDVGKGTLANKPGETPEAGKEPSTQGKAAMDKAMNKVKEEATKAAVQRMRDIAQAEKDVKPLIGDVMGMDSAEEIYRLALDQAGIDLEGVHPSAFKTMVGLVIKQKAEDVAQGKTRSQVKLAHDSKSVAGFRERFPMAGKVQVL